MIEPSTFWAEDVNNIIEGLCAERLQRSERTDNGGTGCRHIINQI